MAYNPNSDEVWGKELRVYSSMSEADYHRVLQQGAFAYQSGTPYAENPHNDHESKAAWIEGWQLAAFHERMFTTRTVQ
ncbi:hypothetical protein [Vibrio diabolicus]|uniref:hypothetical protein n=1 Tax=Vibrio diabolicus TaxID=50719 RepID=UPI0021603445|nr:hypothetical protein [Vibrio diabolicus]MCS0419737.1 hypothetical protein [Vibrio diabolicus]